MRQSPLSLISIRQRPGNPTRGLIFAGPFVFPCALGKAGVKARKQEGDGATPRAVLRPLRVFIRPGQSRPATRLALSRLNKADGWCDDPGDRRYNQPVTIPYPARHEVMWREDHLYDVVIDLDWNRQPAIRGRGSAIFMHLARPGFAPTEGCVAITRHAMLRILPLLGPQTRFVIR